MDPIQQRYHFEKQVLSTPNGTLSEGKDLSLKRQVFLYHVRESKQSNHDETKRLLGSVADFHDPFFLHMLDVGENPEGVYAVLEHRSGSSLQFLIETGSLSLSFQQIISLVLSLGQSIQDALEEKIRGFSLTAENLWFDQEQLMVINYWSEGERHQRGALGFIHLFYQLLFQSSEFPVDLESLEKKLSIFMETSQPDKKEVFIKLVRKVYQGHQSLSSFLQDLKELNKGEPAHSLPESPSASIQQPLIIPHWKRALHLVQKRKLVLGGCLLLLILGYIVLGVIKENDSELVSAVPEDTSAPVKISDPPATSVPIEVETVEPPTSEGTIVVPNLQGLSKEEAEKVALSSGLHYKYFMEYHDLPQGNVFKQEPESGAQVSKETYLTFWISKGSAPQ